MYKKSIHLSLLPNYCFSLTRQKNAKNQNRPALILLLGLPDLQSGMEFQDPGKRHLLNKKI